MDDPKKIEHYINDPIINRLTAPQNKLHRPNIRFLTFFGVFILSNILTLGVCGIGTYIIFLITPQLYDTLDTNFLSIYFRLLPIFLILEIALGAKYFLIWIIRVYQRYALPEVRLRCRFEPSCSEYAILALKRYGTIRGVIKTIGRLSRCKPPGGVDYP